MDNLPDEILGLIIEGLTNPSDIIACACVSHRWASVVAQARVEIDFSSCWIRVTDHVLVSVLRICPSARSIDLKNCVKISDACLLSVPKMASRVERINLCGCCNLGEDAVAEFVHDSPCLKSLSMVHCIRMSDSFARAIGRTGRNLRDLDLAFCRRITDEGLINIVRGCQCIVTLNLSCIPIAVHHNVFREMARCAKKLQRLRCCGCSNITDEDLGFLATGCDNIQDISLVDCANVTDRVRLQHAL